MKLIQEYFAASWVHFLNAIFLGFLPVLVIAVFVTLLMLTFQFVKKTDSIWEVSLVFSVSGAVLGLLLGSSREAAVGAFLPAIISLIAGAIFLSLPKENAFRSLILLAENSQKADDPKYKAEFVIGSIVALMLSSAMGSYWGISIRSIAEDNEKVYEEWRLKYENIEIPLERSTVGLDKESKSDE